MVIGEVYSRDASFGSPESRQAINTKQFNECPNYPLPFSALAESMVNRRHRTGQEVGHQRFHSGDVWSRAVSS